MKPETISKSCRICKNRSVVTLLEGGSHPIGNRFLTDVQEREFAHPLVLGQCDTCGIIQLMNPVASGELVPRFDWITYNEPEPHLDHLVDLITRLSHLTKEARFGGISFKDDSTLERLRVRGFKNTWRLDLISDLGVSNSGAGVETIQDLLTPEKAEEVVRKYGQSDVLIVRHILEHAHAPAKFLRALKKLIKPNGYLVFEVPDCTRALDLLDYTTLWEEHILYFTRETFQQSFSYAGLTCVHSNVYPYPFENSLVAIVHSDANHKPRALAQDVLHAEREGGQRFARSFTQRDESVKRFLTEFRKAEGKIALLGAGHLTMMFINLFGIADFIEYVIDDNPHKQGLFMPGSRLPILGSHTIDQDDIRLILLGVNPISESKIIQNLKSFKDRGGTFGSIFPVSKIWFQNLVPIEEKA